MGAVANADLVDAMRGSLYRLTGRDLAFGLDLSNGLEAAVRRAPYVLVAHDRSPDPVFVYGNDTALALFEMDWRTFTSLPSRLSAEADEQGERERLLQGVAERGYVRDYRGVRVSATGRRFVIQDAVVWDIVDDHGRVRGQAALFDRWTPLEPEAPPVAVVTEPDPVPRTEDWSGRHDLGWSESTLDAATGGALAATVAAAESLPHHDPLPVQQEPVHQVAEVQATPWTSAYDAVEPVAGEHQHPAQPEAQPSLAQPSFAESTVAPTVVAESSVSPSSAAPTVVAEPSVLQSSLAQPPAAAAVVAQTVVAQTVVALDDPLVAGGPRVVPERIAVVEDPVDGPRTRERVRTYLTLGAGSDLAVGYDVDAPPEIRPMTRDELDLVVEWAADAGWNPGLHDAEALWAADPDALWGVEVDGVLVGAGATVRRGSRAGGVGLLLVEPSHRGKGIGSLTFPFLVDGALSRLEAGAGLSLDCPEAHQDFCERFGFMPVRRVARSSTVATSGRRGPYTGQIRALAQLPFEKVVAYDAQFAGGERPDHLRAWMTPVDGLGLGAYEAGQMIGMALLRPARDGFRIGPFYAEHLDVAEDLFVALAGRVVGQKLTLDVPLEDDDVVAFASSKGFTFVSEAVHMQLGQVDEGPRDQVYGESTVEYG